MSAPPSHRHRRLPHVPHVLFALNVTSLPLWDQHAEPPPTPTPGGWAEGPLGSPPSHCPFWDFQTPSERQACSAWELEPSQQTQRKEQSARSNTETWQAHAGRPQPGSMSAFPGLLVSKAPPSSWSQGWCGMYGSLWRDARCDVGVTCWCCGSRQGGRECRLPSEPQDSSNHNIFHPSGITADSPTPHREEQRQRFESFLSVYSHKWTVWVRVQAQSQGAVLPLPHTGTILLFCHSQCTVAMTASTAFLVLSHAGTPTTAAPRTGQLQCMALSVHKSLHNFIPSPPGFMNCLLLDRKITFRLNEGGLGHEFYLN